MSENNSHASSSADDSGKVRNHSESFGKVPNGSEPFRTLPHDAEAFRTVPKASERKENHTLTVREAARMFEVAGVARTERSIVNWCQPNQMGIARLDGYFDPNERKYFITPQSVELAIAEEKAKAAKVNQASEAFGKVPPDSEAFRTVRPDAEGFRTVPKDAETPKAVVGSDQSRIKELERENLDLKITNAAKTQVIELMQAERNQFFDQTIAANRKMGELEAKLLQLERPREIN